MKIFWLEIQKLNYKNLKEKITNFEEQKIVFTPNPEILLEAKKDFEFKNLLQKADFLTSDWIWLYIAYQINENNFLGFVNFLLLPYFFFNLFFKRKYLYKKFWERICGSDLTKDLLFYAEKNNIFITILDLYNPFDEKKVASQKIFREKLQEKFKNLKFDYIIFNPEKKQEIFEKIKNSESKIVFSTLWMKAQEKNIFETMNNCKNLKLWLWVGSSFDYFVWFQKRAPKIWRKIWLEWLYRLITWPQKIKRLKRLYKAIFLFTFKVLKEKKVKN